MKNGTDTLRFHTQNFQTKERAKVYIRIHGRFSSDEGALRLGFLVGAIGDAVGENLARDQPRKQLDAVGSRRKRGEHRCRRRRNEGNAQDAPQ
jgi:hypothetical protein